MTATDRTKSPKHRRQKKVAPDRQVYTVNSVLLSKEKPTILLHHSVEQTRIETVTYRSSRCNAYHLELNTDLFRLVGDKHHVATRLAEREVVYARHDAHHVGEGRAAALRHPVVEDTAGPRSAVRH